MASRAAAAALRARRIGDFGEPETINGKPTDMLSTLINSYAVCAAVLAFLIWFLTLGCVAIGVAKVVGLSRSRIVSDASLQQWVTAFRQTPPGIPDCSGRREGSIDRVGRAIVVSGESEKARLGVVAGLAMQEEKARIYRFQWILDLSGHLGPLMGALGAALSFAFVFESEQPLTAAFSVPFLNVDFGFGVKTLAVGLFSGIVCRLIASYAQDLERRRMSQLRAASMTLALEKSRQGGNLRIRNAPARRKGQGRNDPKPNAGNEQGKGQGQGQNQHRKQDRRGRQNGGAEAAATEETRGAFDVDNSGDNGNAAQRPSRPRRRRRGGQNRRGEGQGGAGGNVAPALDAFPSENDAGRAGSDQPAEPNCAASASASDAPAKPARFEGPRNPEGKERGDRDGGSPPSDQP